MTDLDVDREIDRLRELRDLALEVAALRAAGLLPTDTDTDTTKGER